MILEIKRKSGPQKQNQTPDLPSGRRRARALHPVPLLPLRTQPSKGRKILLSKVIEKAVKTVQSTEAVKTVQPTMASKTLEATEPVKTMKDSDAPPHSYLSSSPIGLV